MKQTLALLSLLIAPAHPAQEIPLTSVNAFADWPAHRGSPTLGNARNSGV